MGFKLSHYTDDTAIVTNDKDMFLSMMPLIRNEVNKQNIRLSPTKFYFQHYSKKIPFLAYEIKKERITPSKRVIHNCKEKIRIYSIYAKSDDKYIYNNAEKYCSILNSYFGIFKHCNSFKLRKILVERVMIDWGNIIEVDETFSKFVIKEKYKKKNKKIYNIKQYRKWTQKII